MQSASSLVGSFGIAHDIVPPPAIDFFPAFTVILPGHCAVKRPPSMVMLAPPLTASTTFLAAAMFTTPLAVLSSSACLAATWAEPAWACRSMAPCAAIRLSPLPAAWSPAV